MFDFVSSVENGITGNHRTEEDEDDRDEVCTVELMRGPHGLGLALVDGMVRMMFVVFFFSIYRSVLVYLSLALVLVYMALLDYIHNSILVVPSL